MYNESIVREKHRAFCQILLMRMRELSKDYNVTKVEFKDADPPYFIVYDDSNNTDYITACSTRFDRIINYDPDDEMVDSLLGFYPEMKV